MDDGAAKFAAKDFQGALESFQAAHTIMGLPITGLELGRAQAALGQLLEARDTLVLVQNMPKQPNEPAPIVKARAAAAQLAQQVGERIPSLIVVVKGVPEGKPSR